MTPERHQQIVDLFQAAWEHSPNDRAAFVAHACAGDQDLECEVSAMLAADQRSGFLEQLPDDLAAGLLAAQKPPPRIGEMLVGRYQILEKIGTGGMGEVYRALDTQLLRDVALKLLPIDVMAGFERRNRFVREGRAASALNHLNIVTIYDIAPQDDPQFIVMEYVPGKTLDKLIPVDLELGLRIACQVASALAKAHSAGIVHRDIKPSNIMLTEDGTVKVLDFGLAKPEQPIVGHESSAMAPLTQPGVIVGTPGYMSPEQAGGRNVDRRSDIFSFGLLLYEMLSGQRAFSGETPEAMIGAILHGQPRSLRGALAQVTPQLNLIVMRCLNKELSQRFQSMIDVKIALENILATRSATGTIPSLAVLPFVNLSADKENEYFADGLAEEIINLLGQTSDLRVIARTSSFSFRGKCVQINKIAQKLKVDHVLEGSVRQTGSRIRVTARLVKAVDEFQLWSQRFDGDIASIFTFQEEIAHAITRELKGKLSLEMAGPQYVRRRPNMDAYNAYLKGRYHLHKFTGADRAKAKESFQTAIEADPDYALGYSGLAMFYLLGSETLTSASRIQPLLDRALELDPSLAEAHAVRGAYLAQFEYDWDAAESEFNRALTSASVSADVYYYYLNFLMPMRRFDEALAAIDKARQLDPLVPTFPLCASSVHLCRGRFQMAIDECDKALELNDRFVPARLNKAWALFEMGYKIGAMDIFELLQQQFGRDQPWIRASIASCLALSNREDEARAILNQLVEERSRTHVPPWLLGTICFSLGYYDELFAFMNEALDEHDPRVLWFVVGLRSAALREDGRFQSLLGRLRLATVS